MIIVKNGDIIIKIRVSCETTQTPFTVTLIEHIFNTIITIDNKY